MVGARGRAPVEDLHPAVQPEPSARWRCRAGGVVEVPVRPLELHPQLRRGPRRQPRGGLHRLPRLLLPLRRPAASCHVIRGTCRPRRPTGLLRRRRRSLRSEMACPGGVSGSDGWGEFYGCTLVDFFFYCLFSSILLL